MTRVEEVTATAGATAGETICCWRVYRYKEKSKSDSVTIHFIRKYGHVQVSGHLRVAIFFWGKKFKWLCYIMHTWICCRRASFSVSVFNLSSFRVSFSLSMSVIFSSREVTFSSKVCTRVSGSEKENETIHNKGSKSLNDSNISGGISFWFTYQRLLILIFLQLSPISLTSF